jgi:Domain of unknown function (DUF4440)
MIAKPISIKGTGGKSGGRARKAVELITGDLLRRSSTTLAALDAALFDSYNRCDLKKFESFFVDDVEFYHDQGGVTLGKAALTESVRKNICGQTTRELVSMQVFYMKGYGALENRRASLPPSRPRGDWSRRRQIHSPLAVQRWRMEDHARGQLRPPLSQVSGRLEPSPRADDPTPGFWASRSGSFQVESCKFVHRNGLRGSTRQH